MDFDKLREKSEIIEKLRTPVGKCRIHSVSGRQKDDRLRNAPGVFRKASEGVFYHFRSLPSYHGVCRSAYRHRMRFFEVYQTSVTLKESCSVNGNVQIYFQHNYYD